MEQYIGLDVSLKETAISIRQDGKKIWRGKCASDPQLLAAVIRKRAPYVRRIVFETGPLSVWFYHSLTAEGLPVICIDARHAKAALDMAANKTDANDADGLAHLAEVGFYREVRVNGFDSMLIRTLITARRQLLKVRLQISNQIRGLMKTFGLVVPKGAGSVFERNVRSLLEGEEKLARIVVPMLQAWSNVRHQIAELSKQLATMAREDQYCRLLMSVPGVGTVTATAFAAAVEDPTNFRNSRAVGDEIGQRQRADQPEGHDKTLPDITGKEVPGGEQGEKRQQDRETDNDGAQEDGSARAHEPGYGEQGDQQCHWVMQGKQSGCYEAEQRQLDPGADPMRPDFNRSGQRNHPALPIQSSVVRIRGGPRRWTRPARPALGRARSHVRNDGRFRGRA